MRGPVRRMVVSELAIVASFSLALLVLALIAALGAAAALFIVPPPITTEGTDGEQGVVPRAA
jgi:hypothetical protein